MGITLKMKINTYYVIIYVFYASFVYTDMGSYDETRPIAIARKVRKTDRKQVVRLSYRIVNNTSKYRNKKQNNKIVVGFANLILFSLYRCGARQERIYA